MNKGLSLVELLIILAFVGLIGALSFATFTKDEVKAHLNEASVVEAINQ